MSVTEQEVAEERKIVSGNICKGTRDEAEVTGDDDDYDEAEVTGDDDDDDEAGITGDDNDDDEAGVAGDDNDDDEAVVAGDDDAVMKPCCGVGRVWIFLAVGGLTLVFSAVVSGIYVTLRTLTTSIDSLQAIPSFLPAAASATSGLLIALLFWKRYKILTYAAVMSCAVAAVLCAVIAVVTGTHVLQPVLSVSECEYNWSRKECLCSRHNLLEKLRTEKDDNSGELYLSWTGMSGCEDLYQVVPALLFTMIGTYAVIALVCVVAAVISTLVYRAEHRNTRLQHLDKQDQYSPLSSVSSDEHDTILPEQATSESHTAALINTYTSPQMPAHRYTNLSTSADNDSHRNNDGNTAVCNPVVAHTETCHIQRCQTFDQPHSGTQQEYCPASSHTLSVLDRTLEYCPANSTSSQRESVVSGDMTLDGAVRTTGKLKEHRRKGRRAVTLHELDRDQLLLILRLQMRYLQESDQVTRAEAEKSGVCNLHTSQPSVMCSEQHCSVTTDFLKQDLLNNKHITGEDLDYRPAKLVRSHTTQSHKSTHECNAQLSDTSQHQFHHHHQQQHQPQLSNQRKPLMALDDDIFKIGNHDLRSTQTEPAGQENVFSSVTCCCCHPEISSPYSSSSVTSCISKLTDSQSTPSLAYAATSNLTNSQSKPSLAYAATSNLTNSQSKPSLAYAATSNLTNSQSKPSLAYAATSNLTNSQSKPSLAYAATSNLTDSQSKPSLAYAATSNLTNSQSKPSLSYAATSNLTSSQSKPSLAYAATSNLISSQLKPSLAYAATSNLKDSQSKPSLAYAATSNLTNSQLKPSLAYAATLSLTTTCQSAETADKVQPLAIDFQDSANSQSCSLHQSSQTSQLPQSDTQHSSQSDSQHSSCDVRPQSDSQHSSCDVRPQSDSQHSSCHVRPQSDSQHSSCHVRKLISFEDHLTSDYQSDRGNVSKNFTSSKNNEVDLVCSRVSDLYRTDGNSSTFDTDRRQIPKEDGSMKLHTLWENVQRTPVSHANIQEFQSEFNHPSLSKHHTFCAGSDANCHDTYVLSELAITPAKSSLQLAQSQAVNTGEFIKSTPVHSYGTRVLLPDVPQFKHVLANSNLNTRLVTDLSTSHQNMFIPISRSPLDSSSNKDHIFSPIEKPHLIPSQWQTSANINNSQAAIEPPRISRRQKDRFEQYSRNLQPITASVDHQLRQSSYTDEEKVDTVILNLLGTSSSQTLPEKLHPVFTNGNTLESPIEAEHSSAPDRPTRNHHIYVQAQMGSHTNGSSIPDRSDDSSWEIDRNILKYQTDRGHCNVRKQNPNFQHNINTCTSSTSAFCLLGCNPASGTSFPSYTSEVGNPDVDSHHPTNVSWQKPRHQSFSSPAHVQAGMSLESVTRMPAPRSASTSSYDPGSTFNIRACTSDFFFAKPQGIFPDMKDRIHLGNRNQARFPPQQTRQSSHHGANESTYHRANQSTYGANQSAYHGANQSPYHGANQISRYGANQSSHHRFYTFQHRHKHQYSLEEYDQLGHDQLRHNQQGYNKQGYKKKQQVAHGSSKDLLHLNKEVLIHGHRQPSASIRRCQSLAERHQPRQSELNQKPYTVSDVLSRQWLHSNKQGLSDSHV